jgi:TRAP-type C4-dicarboxylate transport system permease small subunit
MSQTDVSRNFFVRSINFLSDLFGILSAAAILMSTLIITEGVLVRYIFRTPTIWQVEMAVYLLIFATFLGSPYALKEHAHIHIDLVTHKFSAKTNARLDIITSVIAMIFCLLLAWKGWIMWYEAFDGGYVSESLWSFPLVYPYLFLPLGMSLTSLQFTLRIYKQYLTLSQILRDEVPLTEVA